MIRKPKEDTGRIAVVTAVIKGKSPYAFAKVENDDAVDEATFSLAPDLRVWSEESWPLVDVKVVLFDIRSYPGGWRAHKARYYRPEDEEPKS